MIDRTHRFFAGGYPALREAAVQRPSSKVGANKDGDPGFGAVQGSQPRRDHFPIFWGSDLVTGALAQEFRNRSTFLIRQKTKKVAVWSRKGRMAQPRAGTPSRSASHPPFDKVTAGRPLSDSTVFAPEASLY